MSHTVLLCSVDPVQVAQIRLTVPFTLTAGCQMARGVWCAPRARRLLSLLSNLHHAGAYSKTRTCPFLPVPEPNQDTTTWNDVTFFGIELLASFHHQKSRH